jgi:flagellar basal body-associated protein FliL
MAEPEQEPTPQERSDETTEEGGSRTGVVLLAVMALGVVAIAAGTGYAVGLVLRGSSPASASAATAADVEDEPIGAGAADEGPREYEYIDFEPLLVTLDEPRRDRYVKLLLVLAVRPEDAEEAAKLVEKRKPELKNWLIVYLTGCTLKDVGGPRNLNRIRREIQDSLNEQLWPGRRGRIDHVLFKEFGIQ